MRRMYSEKELKILTIVCKALLVVLGIMALIISIVYPFLVVLAAGLFYFAYKYKAKNKTLEISKDRPAPQEPEPQHQLGTVNAPSKTPNQKHFFFNVVGISKTNDEGENIQKLIKEYVKEYIEFYGDRYEGLTNKEIYDYGEDVYEVDIFGFNEITFEPEPDNPYDSNAIKVQHEDIGHIGYVPRDYTSRVKTVMRGDYKIDWKLIGGRYKYVDYDEDKVRIKTLTYGITLDIYYTS